MQEVKVKKYGEKSNRKEAVILINSDQEIHKKKGKCLTVYLSALI